MSQSFIWAGSFGIAIVGLATLWELAKIARSDSIAKLEKSLVMLMLFFGCSTVGGFGVFAGWEISYPTHLVNGKPRSEAPSTYVYLTIGLLFLWIACAVACAILGFRLKNRRLAPLMGERRRIQKALVAEYGDAEQVTMIMERTGLNDQLRDAEQEGF